MCGHIRNTKWLFCDKQIPLQTNRFVFENKIVSFITRNHSSNLVALYFSPLDQIDEHIKNYFPHTYIRCFADFVLSK
jgi:hypothetical protein